MDDMERRSFINRAALAGAGAAAAVGGGLSLFGGAEEALAAVAQTRTVKSLRFEVIVKTVASDYWQIVLHAAQKAAAQMGVQGLNFTGSRIGEQDYAGEIALLEDAIAKKPDYVVFAASDKTAMNATIEKAYNAGIKVILIDSAVTTTKYQ